jgi:hypothetical protein
MAITNSREIGDTGVGVKIGMEKFGDDGVLSGAERGTQASAAIERAIEQLRDDQPVVLDFSGVRAVSVPFVDASIGRLLSGRVAGYYDANPMVIYGANFDVRQTIDASLRLHRLYALAVSDDGAELLGADEVLATTLREAATLESFNVHQLADRLALTPQAANNRLRTLLRSGALQRERATPQRGRGGREFRYRIPAGS